MLFPRLTLAYFLRMAGPTARYWLASFTDGGPAEFRRRVGVSGAQYRKTRRLEWYFTHRIPRLRLRVRGEGGDRCAVWEGVCPFCRVPQFRINPSSGEWFCANGCGRHGTPPTLEEFLGASGSQVEALSGCLADPPGLGVGHAG